MEDNIVALYVCSNVGVKNAVDFEKIYPIDNHRTTKYNDLTIMDFFQAVHLARVSTSFFKTSVLYGSRAFGTAWTNQVQRNDRYWGYTDGEGFLMRFSVPSKYAFGRPG